MNGKMPVLNINYNVYNSNSNQMLGIADVTLPDLEAMTETISGAGIAGELDMPVLGHFGSMTVTFNWRVLNVDSVTLAQQMAHQLDLRGSIENYDSSSGTIGSTPVKVTVLAIPKTMSLGNLNVGTTADTSNEMEIAYMRVFINNEERVELDKFNYIFRVNGVDYLDSVRRDLGLA
jgi:P2 family phage contractile tail tube protein